TFASAIAVLKPDTLTSASTTVHSQVLDLKAEAKLDPEIQYSIPPDLEQTDSPSGIFLTGATGFVGSYLLSELLQQTQADI
ncbi:SDR family oxidoreductase, partial [Tritonibacter sp. SIMBA_163]|uniref:SDR family oxidoreductase n=1 Tax=Tritonibacter sp. SIMBA_163 TaxID=3080868 RepID=UPI00397E950D